MWVDVDEEDGLAPMNYIFASYRTLAVETQMLRGSHYVRWNVSAFAFVTNFLSLLFLLII